MLARTASSILQLFLCALVTWICLQPVGLRAERADRAANAAAVTTPAPVCALLQSKLRWHEPFFGLQTGAAAAAEALAHASAACREAIAAGQAPDVASALRELEKHAVITGAELRRFTYRLSCQLRVPEARRQILAGLHEPGVYADCADALFTMPWSDPETRQLRQTYLEGLRNEPLQTHVPSALLRPPYSDQLAPVLRAYDQAQRRGRDTLYRAICLQTTPVSAESKAVCAARPDREPEWITQKLVSGHVEAGLDEIGALGPAQLPHFSALLRKLDAEQTPGRDRLYGLLCLRHPPQAAELRAACNELPTRAEPRWLALRRAERTSNLLDHYNFGGRLLSGTFIVVGLLLIAERMVAGRRRRAWPI